MDVQTQEQEMANPEERRAQWAEAARKLREDYLRDPHRPGYHFVVPEGVHGPVDPNGAIFHNGRYHLFYIYQHEKKHYWGHVSSLDLLHWRHHQPGLTPGEGDDGIFSGGAALDRDGVATITYWGLRSGDGVCLATSTDEDLDTWRKNAHNPVLPGTQWGLANHPATAQKPERIYGVADPSALWVENGKYYLLTGNLLVLKEIGEKGNRPEHQGDTAYLCESDDLVHWRYLHPLYTSRREWTRATEDCMCPDFFPLPRSPEGGPAGERQMLLFISHNYGCQYYLGRYAGLRYTPDTHGRMTWSDKTYFAPESLCDGRGRRILWTWLMDGRPEGMKRASGWSGELSLPRVLWEGEDGTLRMMPAPELERLRYAPHVWQSLTLTPGTPFALTPAAGNSVELRVCLQPAAHGRTGLRVLHSPGGEEETLIYYDADRNVIAIDTTRSSLLPPMEADAERFFTPVRGEEAGEFSLRPGEELDLRVFLDRSVIEVYANDRQAVVRHVYPTRPDSTGIALFSDHAGTRARQISTWKMMPSNGY